MVDESGKALKEAIVRTVSWFSLFSYPVCAEDIWKWLIAPEEAFTLSDVRQVLGWSKWSEGILQEHDGWYALAAHKPILEMQQERRDCVLDSVRKYKKLRRAVWWFGLLSAVRGVAAVNTLAWWNTKPTSDIDLSIVVKPGTLWITRLLLVVPFALLGKRPMKSKEGKVSLDPFCFSFFVTTDVGEIERLQIKGGDPDLAFWVRATVPLFDRDGWFGHFQKKNTWVKNYFPNAPEATMHEKLAVRSLCSISFPWKQLDAWAKRIQKKRFPDKIKELANKDTRVVVSGQMLKFHVCDRREEYRDRWISTYNQL
jgi:hypothetical protein